MLGALESCGAVKNRGICMKKFSQDAEQYLVSYAVLDGRGNMDGMFVPLSVAMIACQAVLDGRMKLNPPTWIGPGRDEKGNDLSPPN